MAALLFLDFVADRGKPRRLVGQGGGLGGEGVALPGQPHALGAPFLSPRGDARKSRVRTSLPLAQLGQPTFPLGFLPPEVLERVVEACDVLALLPDAPFQILELAAQSEQTVRLRRHSENSDQ